MSTIKIMALRHSAFYSPLLMTIAGGYLKNEGLSPEYTVSTPDKTVPENLLNGSINLAQSAVATSFEYLEQGRPVDIVHFAQINARDGFFIAAREPDNAFTWDKLIGKEVLVDHFFQPKAMFRYALYKKGIEMNELQIIDAGSVEDIEKTFRNGVGEYVHMQGPAPQQMEKEGVGHVVASVGEVIGPVAFSSLCATREWCSSEMARIFMRSYIESLKFVIQADAREIAELEMAAGFFPGIDKGVLISTIKAYQKLGTWEYDPIIKEEYFDNLLDVFMMSGLIKKRHSYSDIIIRPPL